MTCPDCGCPLIASNGQDICPRCDTPRRSEGESQGPSVVAQATLTALDVPDFDRELSAKADTATLNLLKAASVETASEMLELVGLSKAQRLAGQVRDPTKTARNLAAVFNAITEKRLLLEGRPTQITEHRDLEDYVKLLGELAPGAVTVDGTAEELEELPPAA